MNENNSQRPSTATFASAGTGSVGSSTDQRRKTTKEQIQDVLSIQNDFKNRNTTPSQIIENDDEFNCFLGKLNPH